MITALLLWRELCILFVFTPDLAFDIRVSFVFSSERLLYQHRQFSQFCDIYPILENSKIKREGIVAGFSFTTIRFLARTIK